MKILTISDTHNKHMLIPSKYIDNIDGEFDMIIHAGDISSTGTKNEITIFMNWYSKLPYKHKILIAGNHDFFLEEAPEYAIDKLLSEYPEIIYLNDSGVEIDGFKIWGSPVQPYFHNWAFNRIGDDICKHWDLIPLDTDILISHGPVKGYLDLTIEGSSTGCPYLLDRISKLSNLKLFVHGHIHEAYGKIYFPDGGIFINASVLDRRYNMTNLPIEVEINK